MISEGLAVLIQCSLCREKVVAVFVHGPKWQFKQWLWKEPVEIFAKSAFPRGVCAL